MEPWTIHKIQNLFFVDLETNISVCVFRIVSIWKQITPECSHMWLKGHDQQKICNDSHTMTAYLINKSLFLLFQR